MKVAVTPHLGVAAAIALCSLFIAFDPLVTGPGSHDLTVTELKIAPTSADKAVMPAARALDPLVADFSDGPQSNPFTLRKTTVAKGPRIPFPPPPPLEPPTPAVLPLPVEEKP